MKFRLKHQGIFNFICPPLLAVAKSAFIKRLRNDSALLTSFSDATIQTKKTSANSPTFLKKMTYAT
jgi:hypothetical protein